MPLLRADDFQDVFAGRDKHCDAQACRRLAGICKRRNAPDGGLGGGTCPPKAAVTAIGDGFCGKRPRGMRDSLAKGGRPPGRPTLRSWFVHRPRMAAPPDAPPASAAPRLMRRQRPRRPAGRRRDRPPCPPMQATVSWACTVADMKKPGGN